MTIVRINPYTDKGFAYHIETFQRIKFQLVHELAFGKQGLEKVIVGNLDSRSKMENCILKPYPLYWVFHIWAGGHYSQLFFKYQVKKSRLIVFV